MDKRDDEIKSVVAVTSCPTGVAHTFMAAKALENEATKRNISIKVQKNASSGIIDELTLEDIANADGVIIAADIKVNLDNFENKRIIKTTTKKALSNASIIFDKLKNAKTQKSIAKQEDYFSGKMNVYQHILTGISFMLPFVIAGGIITAVSFFWGIHSYDINHSQYNKFASSLKAIGAAGMTLMIPVLAGYIGYSIGDRPAIVPGFIGGWLANTGFDGLTNDTGNYTSGFLGAIVAGLISGYVIQLLKLLTRRIPEKINSIRPMLIYPLFATLLVGLVVLWGLNVPIGIVQSYIDKGLKNIGSIDDAVSISSSLLLALVLGVLISVDFGGPFNKVAYLFGVADLTMKSGMDQKSVIMAAVSAGCIVPSLATGVAVTLFPFKYTNNERNAGYTNYLLGATHITEGAISFAAKKPVRNIPCFMIGSVTACLMSLLLGAATPAPHGGLLVIALVDKWYWWLLSILAGTLISGLLLGLFASNELLPSKTNILNSWMKSMWFSFMIFIFMNNLEKRNKWTNKKTEHYVKIINEKNKYKSKIKELYINNINNIYQAKTNKIKDKSKISTLAKDRKLNQLEMWKNKKMKRLSKYE